MHVAHLNRLHCCKGRLKQNRLQTATAIQIRNHNWASRKANELSASFQFEASVASNVELFSHRFTCSRFVDRIKQRRLPPMVFLRAHYFLTICRGLVLQDLTFVNVGNSDYLSPDHCQGKTNLLNYGKRWQQFAILDSVRRFKSW